MSQNKWKYGDLLFCSGFVSVVVWGVLIVNLVVLFHVFGSFLVAEDLKIIAARNKANAMIGPVGRQNYTPKEEKFFNYPFNWHDCTGPHFGPGRWHVEIFEWISKESFKSFDPNKVNEQDIRSCGADDFPLLVDNKEGQIYHIPQGYEHPESHYFYKIKNLGVDQGWVQLPRTCLGD